MSRRSRSKGSRISSEEKLLEKQREEILLRQQQLEKRLKRLPVVLEEQQQQKREFDKRRAAAAAPPISPYLGRGGRRKTKSRSLRTPSRERFVAKLWTLGLVVVLLVIGFMLWRVIPAS